jgi:hypothetical protein
VAKSPEEALRPREEDTGDTIIVDIGLPDYLEDDLSDLEEPEEPVFRGGNAPALRETQEGLSKTQASPAPYSLRLKGPIVKGSIVQESTAQESIAQKSTAPEHIKSAISQEAGILKTVTEALEGSDKAHWAEAIQVELTKLQALGTWEYVELPPGKKAIGCKWVFTIKYTPIRLIDHYKARLIAQGFTQTPGDDYLETFSPIIRAESLCTLLVIGAYKDLEMR